MEQGQRMTEFQYQRAVYHARHSTPKEEPVGLSRRIKEIRMLDMAGKMEGIRRWVDFGMVDFVTGLVIDERLNIPEDTGRELVAQAFEVRSERDRAKRASIQEYGAADLANRRAVEELTRSADEALEIAGKLRGNAIHDEDEVLPVSPFIEPVRRRRFGFF